MNALEKAIAEINKKFWEWTTNYLDASKRDIPVTSSWCFALDEALGGWYADGRIIELFGMESSGKTTLALHAIKEVQDKWWVAAFVDMEHAFDPWYAEDIGIDLDKLVFSQPSYWEQAVDIIKAIAESWDVRLIVLDSIAMMIPKKELDWNSGDPSVMTQAKLMNQALRQWTGIMNKNNCTLILINQIRQTVVTFWSNEVTTWWLWTKFAATQRIRVGRTATITWQIKDSETKTECIWTPTNIHVIKNKVSAPFKKAEFNILYWVGIDQVSDFIKYATNYWLIEWRYKINWESVAKTLLELKTYLENNQVLYKALRKDLGNIIRDTIQ
jgi:recombination protein RecA